MFADCGVECPGAVATTGQGGKSRFGDTERTGHRCRSAARIRLPSLLVVNPVLDKAKIVPCIRTLPRTRFLVRRMRTPHPGGAKPENLTVNRHGSGTPDRLPCQTTRVRSTARRGVTSGQRQAQSDARRAGETAGSVRGGRECRRQADAGTGGGTSPA